MEHFLKPGLNYSLKKIVTNSELASVLQTGDAEVLATPSLIVLMEQVICKLLQEHLPPSFTSISSEINIKHFLSVKEGEYIICSVHLKFVDAEKLFFDFAIFNEHDDTVALGAHERYVVLKDEFNK